MSAALVLAATVVIAPRTGGAEDTGPDAVPELVDTQAGASEEADKSPANEHVDELRQLAREVDGLSGDVADVLAELQELELLLTELASQPEAAVYVAQLRSRIERLRLIQDGKK